jgi:hypothetical protein
MPSAGGSFDIAVLVEQEMTDDSARRLVQMYQSRNVPVRFSLVRSLRRSAAQSRAAGEQAELLMQKTVQQLRSLGAKATGVVVNQPPADAVAGLITTTRSHEVVVVARRRALDVLLRQDLVSQVRSRVRLPVSHLPPN